jgi:hypothetical protein
MDRTADADGDGDGGGAGADSADNTTSAGRVSSCHRGRNAALVLHRWTSALMSGVFMFSCRWRRRWFAERHS